MPRDPREPSKPSCGCSDPPVRDALPSSPAGLPPPSAVPLPCDLPPSVGSGDPSSVEDPTLGSSAPGCASDCREAVSRRSYDFTNLATSSSLEIVLERVIETASFADAVLQVRVHAVAIPSGATLECIVRATSPCDDEPGTDFVDPSPVGKVTLDNTVTAPTLRQAPLAPSFARAVQLVLKGTRGATAGTFNATLSLCVVLKEHPTEPALLRAYTTHSYDDSTGALRYIPFTGTTAGTTLSAANNELRMIAPYDGWLRRVTVLSSIAGGAGSTVVGLHKNENATATATRTATVGVLVATTFEFGADAGFVAGERLSVSLDPSSGPADANVTCEWVFRRG